MGVESGREDNRPQLRGALAQCRKCRAVLIIPKLGRLARNVHFISGPTNCDVEFLAIDMPTANRLALDFFAAVAEHEREMISQRARVVLAAAKGRGTKPGDRRAVEAAAISRAAKNVQATTPEVVKLMTEWDGRGTGFREIAREYHRLNIRTPQGRLYPSAVRSQLA